MLKTHVLLELLVCNEYVISSTAGLFVFTAWHAVVELLVCSVKRTECKSAYIKRYNKALLLSLLFCYQ